MKWYSQNSFIAVPRVATKAARVPKETASKAAAIFHDRIRNGAIT